ncbi:MAG: mitochondrial fission ELM1 family protein [Coraliomargaritaceae bacterium]
MNRVSKSSESKSTPSLVVWRITDGKPGHEAQSAGLVSALGRLCEVDCYDLPPLGGWVAFRHWLFRDFPEGGELPDPDFIVGAGHRTHATLLAARRARGGKAVVLMRPSLPVCWFDWCLVPAHDRPKEKENVVVTQGVLNAMEPALDASIERGLILIGGPSAHYDWDTEGLLDQVRRVVRADPAVRWVCTTSRRTPKATECELLALDESNLEVVPFAQTTSGWVALRLQERGLVWVSEDSVSMVYEALTAGARVGLLGVPKKGSVSRVARGVDALLESGRIVLFADPLPDLSTTNQNGIGFNEADRCARCLLSDFTGNG